MSESRTESARASGSTNGVASSELEARLRRFFGEQQRLRALLDQTLAEVGLLTLREIDNRRARELSDQVRADLDRINAELLQFQHEYCTDPARAEEYDRTIERILGFDPRISLSEVQEFLAGKRHCDMKEQIEVLERLLQESSAQGGQ